MLAAIIFILLAVAPAFAEEYGSITGIVTSANNAAVPDAVVTLWAIVDGTPALSVAPNNPQYTSNFSSSVPGMYAFTNVPPGVYNITAEKGGHLFYTMIDLKSGGTATANIVIPEPIEALATATPQPTPKTYYTYVPVRVSSPLPQATTRSPGFEALTLISAIPLAILIRKRLKF